MKFNDDIIRALLFLFEIFDKRSFLIYSLDFIINEYYINKIRKKNYIKIFKELKNFTKSATIIINVIVATNDI